MCFDVCAQMDRQVVPDLTSKYHSPVMGSRISGEIVDFWARAGKLQDEPQVFFVPESKKMLQESHDIKEHWRQ